MSTIVVGAGLSGLAAARRLADHGEDVVVLEAQGHVGGRTRSDRDRLLHGQPADLGASFVDIGQDLLLAYCVELNVPLTPRFPLYHPDPDGRLSAAAPFRGTVVTDGIVLPELDRELIATEIRSALDETPPAPAESLLAWSGRARLSERSKRLLVAQAGMNPVQRSEYVPVSMHEPPTIGKVCWLLADGTDSVARAMATGVDIRLDHPVRVIQRHGHDGVTVETDHGKFTARDVVVATPLKPTLNIGFDPVLPPWKLDALLSTPMTQGGKVVGQYADGSEILDRIDLLMQSDGPITTVFARPLGPEDTVVLLGLAADRADGLLRDEERALRELDEMVRIGTGVTPRRLAGIVQDWTQEEFIGGVVSMAEYDSPRLTHLLARGIDNLHFAGEHTAGVWTTAMDGALRSGERAADEVLERRLAAIGTSSVTP